MSQKQVRKRCQETLESIALPIPFDIEAFCKVVEQRTGRPIILRPWPTLGDPFGLWVHESTRDVIYYLADTSYGHQIHIILHELSHLLLEHDPLAVSEMELSLMPFKHLEAQQVKQLLARARGAYSAVEEREAEELAYLIEERVRTQAFEGPMERNPVNGILSRLEEFLEGGGM